MIDAALDPLLRALLRAGLAVLFGVSAVHKLRDLDEFRRVLRGYALLPERAVAPAARVLPLCEVVLAAALLAGAAAAGSSPLPSLAGAALLSLYGAAIAVNLARGRRDIDCGCMGPSGRRGIGPGLVARNALLIAAALASALPPSARPLHALDAWTAIATLSFAGLALAAFQVARANAARLAALRVPASHAIARETARR